MSTTTPLAQLGGQFFSQTPDHVFTVEAFQPDERLMIRSAEDFIRGEVLPHVEALDRQEDGLMPGLIAKAGELGFCGVDTPDAYGGLGLGKNLAARILEFLSLNASFSVTVGITSGISQVGLTLFGTEEQKRQYLPRLTAGQSLGAYCLSEPNAGSDALSLTTRAERRGDKWVLNGTKMWISNAKWAEFFLVLAKIDGEHLSTFIVERGFPGVSVAREEHKMGLKGSSTARVVFEDAEVPLENLLYEPGKGHQVALNALNLGRFKLAAMSIGPARDALGHAATYATERRQFGKAIGEFGLIRQKLAEMAALYYLAESVTYRTGALIDGAFEAFGGTIEGNKRAAEEFSIECSAAKVLATEVEAFLVDEAVQIYGGYGFTEEFPVARHYRDARISRIYEGTNEINRVFLASRLLKRAQEGRISLAGSGDSWVGELAARAFAVHPEDQIRLGALSDLAMLHYADQSCRLRAAQTRGWTHDLDRIARSWIHQRAAAAYQRATGEAVSIPAPDPFDLENVAVQVMERKGPL